MSDYNSTDKTQAITVTKIVSPGVLPPVTTQLKSLLMQTMKLMCSLQVSLRALDSILISEMKVSVTGMNHRRLSVRNVENREIIQLISYDAVSLSSLFSFWAKTMFSMSYFEFSVLLWFNICKQYASFFRLWFHWNTYIMISSFQKHLLF